MKMILFSSVIVLSVALAGCSKTSDTTAEGSGGSMEGAGGAGPGYDGSGSGGGKKGLAARDGSGTGADYTNSVGSGPQTSEIPSKNPSPGNETPPLPAPAGNGAVAPANREP